MLCGNSATGPGVKRHRRPSTWAEAALATRACPPSSSTWLHSLLPLSGPQLVTCLSSNLPSETLPAAPLASGLSASHPSSDSICPTLSLAGPVHAMPECPLHHKPSHQLSRLSFSPGGQRPSSFPGLLIQYVHCPLNTPPSMSHREVSQMELFVCSQENCSSSRFPHLVATMFLADAQETRGTVLATPFLTLHIQ